MIADLRSSYPQEWIAGINFCACFRAAGLKVTNLDTFALMNGDRLLGGNSMSRSSSQGGSDRQWSTSDPFAQPGPAAAAAASSSSATPAPQATPAQLLRAKVAARRRELVPKLEIVNRTLYAHSNELQELLRLARQFTIMTPFQRSTRERIEAAATPLAARIRQLRIEVAKYECRQYILSSEVQVNDRAASQAAAGQDNLMSPSLIALAQQERKGSYFAAEGFGSSEDDGELRSSQRSPTEMRKASSGNVGSLRPVAEAPGEGSGETASTSSPIPAIGSFARLDNSDAVAVAPSSKNFDFRSRISRSRVKSNATSSGAGGGSGSHHSDTASLSSRSNKSGGAGGVNPAERAESWNTTRAFRDPDRISVAQLPSLETIEAATREKARRRVAQQPHNKGGLFTSTYSSTTLSSPDGGPGQRKGSIASSGPGGAASSSGGGAAPSTFSYTSHGSRGSDREIPVNDRRLDPPVFMSTWGA